MDKKLTWIALGVLISAPWEGAWAGEASSGSESRFLFGKKRQELILQKRAKLQITGQKSDPFGLLQDVTVQKITKTQKRVIKTNAFPKAIAKIPINIVMGKSFCIGSREIKENEHFPLDYKGNHYKVKVISVRSSQITFKNMETGEQVIKKMGGLPEGVGKSTGAQSFPGLIPAGKDQGEIKIQD